MLAKFINLYSSIDISDAIWYRYISVFDIPMAFFTVISDLIATGDHSLSNEPVAAANEERTSCLPENTHASGYSTIRYEEGNALYFVAMCPNNYESLSYVSCFDFHFGGRTKFISPMPQAQSS